MTVQTFPSSYVSTEENDRQKTKAEHVSAEFNAEFEDMCNRNKS